VYNLSNFFCQINTKKTISNKPERFQFKFDAKLIKRPLTRGLNKIPAAKNTPAAGKTPAADKKPAAGKPATKKPTANSTKKHQTTEPSTSNETMQLKNRIKSLMETNAQLRNENVNMKNENEDLKRQILRGNNERKDLNNIIMDLRGNIRVFCRIRQPIRSNAVAKFTILNDKLGFIVNSC
jgi:regulator of replication initiation timing